MMTNVHIHLCSDYMSIELHHLAGSVHAGHEIHMLQPKWFLQKKRFLPMVQAYSFRLAEIGTLKQVRSYIYD